MQDRGDLSRHSKAVFGAPSCGRSQPRPPPSPLSASNRSSNNSGTQFRRTRIKRTVGLRPTPSLACGSLSSVQLTAPGRVSNNNNSSSKDLSAEWSSHLHTTYGHTNHTLIPAQEHQRVAKSSVGENQRSHVAGIVRARPRGETNPPHGMRMSFSELRTVYTHREAALTFTC